jgi:cbb3-type cytochrome oxidase subunit 3
MEIAGGIIGAAILICFLACLWWLVKFSMKHTI